MTADGGKRQLLAQLPDGWKAFWGSRDDMIACPPEWSGWLQPLVAVQIFRTPVQESEYVNWILGTIKERSEQVGATETLHEAIDGREVWTAHRQADSRGGVLWVHRCRYVGDSTALCVAAMASEQEWESLRKDLLASMCTFVLDGAGGTGDEEGPVDEEGRSASSARTTANGSAPDLAVTPQAKPPPASPGPA